MPILSLAFGQLKQMQVTKLSWKTVIFFFWHGFHHLKKVKSKWSMLDRLYYLGVTLMWDGSHAPLLFLQWFPKASRWNPGPSAVHQTSHDLPRLATGLPAQSHTPGWAFFIVCSSQRSQPSVSTPPEQALSSAWIVLSLLIKVASFHSPF